jgi:two-component system response regulator
MNRTGQFILLVDDNPDDVEMTLMAFTKSNIANEVVVVNDGQEALDYLFGTGAWEGRNCLAMPNIILLDLNLPKVSGLQVLRRIRADARTKLLPVVILTTSSEDNDLVSSYDLGANSYVRKPVDFEQFVEAVRRLGFYWLLVNERPPSPRNPQDD